MNYFYDRNLQHVSIAVSSEITTDEIIEYYPANESADDQAAITVSSSDAPEKYSIAKENRDISLLEPVCAAVPAEDTDLKLPTQQPEDPLEIIYTLEVKESGVYYFEWDLLFGTGTAQLYSPEGIKIGSEMTGDTLLNNLFLYKGIHTVKLVYSKGDTPPAGKVSISTQRPILSFEDLMYDMGQSLEPYLSGFVVLDKFKHSITDKINISLSNISVHARPLGGAYDYALRFNGDASVTIAGFTFNVNLTDSNYCDIFINDFQYNDFEVKGNFNAEFKSSQEGTGNISLGFLGKIQSAALRISVDTKKDNYKFTGSVTLKPKSHNDEANSFECSIGVKQKKFDSISVKAAGISFKVAPVISLTEIAIAGEGFSKKSNLKLEGKAKFNAFGTFKVPNLSWLGIKGGTYKVVTFGGAISWKYGDNTEFSIGSNDGTEILNVLNGLITGTGKISYSSGAGLSAELNATLKLAKVAKVSGGITINNEAFNVSLKGEIAAPEDWWIIGGAKVSASITLEISDEAYFSVSATLGGWSGTFRYDFYSMTTNKTESSKLEETSERKKVSNSLTPVKSSAEADATLLQKKTYFIDKNQIGKDLVFFSDLPSAVNSVSWEITDPDGKIYTPNGKNHSIKAQKDKNGDLKISVADAQKGYWSIAIYGQEDQSSTPIDTQAYLSSRLIDSLVLSVKGTDISKVDFSLDLVSANSGFDFSLYYDTDAKDYDGFLAGKITRDAQGNFTWDVPEYLVDNRFYFYVKAEHKNSQYAFSNYTGITTLIAPKYKINAKNISLSCNCYDSKETVMLNWDFVNSGNIASEKFNSLVILSADKEFSEDDEILSTVYHSSIGAGKTSRDYANIKITDSQKAAQYKIGIVSNYKNEDGTITYDNVTWMTLKPSSVTTSSNYGQLLTVPTWNQYGPWNNNCPMSASEPDKRTIAGCGPIAAAQILYALKAPGSLTFDSSDAYSKNGISIDSAYSSLDFPSFEELNKKLSSIKYDNSPEEAAMLTFAVGVKLQASYTASATSSYIGTAFFTEDCGFDSAKYMSISSAKNSDGTFKQEYIDVIADNIKNGSPVLLNIPNHYVFIEDYDRLSNKFYINYGWGGSNDGWYHLHDINGQETKGVMFDIIPEFGNEPIVVNSTADYGVGTLRRAIELANNVKGENSIVFDRSMAGKTITIDSELQITDKVNITGLDSANVTITRSGSFSVLYQNSNAAGSTYSGITVDGNNYSSDVMRFYGDSQLSNVTIKNAAGNAIYAAYNTITALDNKCNLNPGTSKRLVNVPGKISSAKAVYKDKTIKFSWTNANDKEDGTVNSCRIEYSESADMSDAKSVTATGTSFTLKNVAAARNYFWRICNVDKDGNDGIFSEVRHIYTGSDTTAPSAVSGLTAKLEDIRAFLSWKPAADKHSKVSHYILEYANNKSFSKATRITTEDTSFKLSGLTTDLAYYWRVAAVDHCGNQSSFSPAKTFTANPRTLIVTEALNDPIKTDRNLKIEKSGSCIVTGSQFSENSYAYPVNLTGYTTEVYHYGTLKLSAAKNSAALIKAANITGGVIGGTLYIDGNASNKTLYGISASNLQLNGFSTKLTVKSSGSMNGYGIYISDSLSEIDNFSGSITITVPQSAYAIYSYGTMTIKNLSAAAALNISSTESNARGIYLYNYDDIKDFSLTIDNLQCKISVNSANGSSTGIQLANSSAKTDCNIYIGKWSGTTTVSANTYSYMLNHSCYSSEVHNGSTSIKTFSAKAVVSSKSSQAYGISSDYRINIGNLSGSIMVSSENTGAYGILGDSTVKITGTLATNANSNSSAIYSETQSNITVSGIVAAIKDRYNASTNKSAVANFVSQLRKYRSGSVSSLPQAERGYAFCCYGNENDTITLQNKALVYGNTYFSGGNDKLTIYSGAQLSGSINANGNLNITFKINSFGNKALITTASLYELTDSATSLNISLDSYLPGGKQILIKYDGTRASFDKEITVSFAGKKYTMSANGTAKTVNGYTLKLSWEKQSQLVLTCSDKRTLSKLSGSSKTLSWKAGSTPTDGFSLDYSSDKFDHTLRINSATSSVDIFSAPKNSYQWKVKYAERDTWFNGADIAVAAVSKTPKTITANANGNMDVMFTTTYAKWSSNYQAKHKGIKNIWSGTAETEELSGKNKIADIFKGSSDANILLLTDDANGDALFLDDIYTDLPKTTLKNQARVIQIKEIRAGNGDDIIDMTSQQYSYTGSGVRIYGGSGNDIIWANKGNHTIFGDSGNDRIIGGNGNDVLAGGAGNDRMHGGGGKDIFTFGSNWGKDFVEQLDGGEVTLWFKSGSIDKWNDKTLTYADGNNFVHVSGVSNDKITLKFGDDKSTKFDTLNDSKAFSDTASEKIFEDKNKGMLA